MEDDEMFELKLWAEYTTSNWINSFELPEKLYHYTDDKGYKGIINDESLIFWFIRSDCFLDKKEGKDILKHYKRACKHALKGQKIDKDFLKKIYFLKPQKRVLLVDIENQSFDCPKYECYIFCFTCEGNSERMWEKSGKGKQKCKLELSPEILNGHMVCKKSGSNNSEIVKSYKIIYDTKEKQDILYDRIINAYKLYKMGLAEKNPASAKKIKSLLRYELHLLQYSFKKGKYDFENEYRIMYIRPLKSGYPEVKKSGKKTYIELPINKENFVGIEIRPHKNYLKP